MLEIHGRQVPVTLEELVEPSSTALVVIDVQNDICLPEGKQFSNPLVVRQGGTGGYAPVLQRLRTVIPAARKAGVQVFYTKLTMMPNHQNDSAAFIRYRMKRFFTEDLANLPQLTDFVVDGSWGHEICDAVRPEPEDVIVRKPRSDSFVGTDFDLLLKMHGIKTVVLCGAQTDGCCMSTARGANHHDYFVVVLEDCVNSFNAENHKAALQIMRSRFDVFTSEQVLHAWGAPNTHERAVA
jgi:nicotinamidase-related amidase